MCVAEGILVVLVYSAAVIVLLSPLFDDPWSRVLDPDRPWLTGGLWESPSGMIRAMTRDIYLFIWIYAWDWHALTTSALSLFEANAFYPAPGALAFSEHALGKIPITGPLFALSGNPVFAYQVDLLLSFSLSGAALYALLRSVGTARGAAFVGGLLYAVCPARIDSLYQTYLLAGQYLPLVLLFAERTLFGGRVRDAAGLMVFLLLLLLSSYYLAYQTLIAVGAYGIAVLWATRGRFPATGLAWASVSGGIAAALFVAISLPYLRKSASGVVLDYQELWPALVASANGAWRNYLTPPFLLRAELVPPLARGGYNYVGWVSVGFFALGAVGWSGESPARRRLRFGALAITIACWIMALGPAWATGDGPIWLPYAAAMKWIPGFASMRVPSRFALSMMLGWTVVAGLGIDRCLRSLAARGLPRLAGHLAAAVLAALVCLDYGYGVEEFGTRRIETATEAPPVYGELAKLPPGPVLELPLGAANGLFASEYMVQSTVHWMPLLNGSSGYLPPSLKLTEELARRFPDPRAVEMLQRMTGLRYVVVHTDHLSKGGRARWRGQPSLRRLGLFGRDLLFEVDPRGPPDLRAAFVACAEDGSKCAPLRERPGWPDPVGGERSGTRRRPPRRSEPLPDGPTQN